MQTARQSMSNSEYSTFIARSPRSSIINRFPTDIPIGTAIPAWAFIDPTVRKDSFPRVGLVSLVFIQTTDRYDAALAQANVSECFSILPLNSADIFIDSPESIATSMKVTGTRATATGTGAGASSTAAVAKKSSNAGAIAGGVVGGVVVIGIIAALLTWFIMRRRRARVAPSAAYGSVYTPSMPPGSPPPMSQHATEYNSVYSASPLNAGHLSPAPRLYVSVSLFAK